MNAKLTKAWEHRDLRVLVIGEGVSMFGSMVSRLAAAAALCLSGRAARRVHRAADVAIIWS